MRGVQGFEGLSIVWPLWLDMLLTDVSKPQKAQFFCWAPVLGCLFLGDTFIRDPTPTSVKPRITQVRRPAETF